MFSIQMRTTSLTILKRRFGIDLREFHNLQYRKMKDATTLVHKVAKEQGRSSGMKRRTGKGLWNLRRRVRRIGPAEFMGQVYFDLRKAFYMAILQAPSRVVSPSGKSIGMRRGFPFMKQAADATEARVVKMLGDSFKVFTS